MSGSARRVRETSVPSGASVTRARCWGSSGTAPSSHPPVRDGTESFGIVGCALDEDAVGQVEEGADLLIRVAEIPGDGNVAVDRRHGQREAGALKVVRGEVHLISPRFGSVFVPSQAQVVEILNGIRLVSRVTDDNDRRRHA